ncbi:MAG TPA: DUF2294 domain-containing protein [Thermoleophilaceae bacterium]|jgi:uncharacterized protein YbcI
MRAPEELLTGEVSAKISNAVVKLLHEYTGRGPTKAKTHFGSDIVTVVLADTFTRAERSLMAAGNGRMVLDTRREFQNVMRDDYTAAVEEITGRNVIAFMSDSHADPDLAVEVFVLEPEEADAPVDGDGPARLVPKPV